MTKAVLSRVEAAEYLGISTDTLDRLRACGRIVASPVSARLIRYRSADLDAYLIECRASPSSTSQPRQPVRRQVFSHLQNQGELYI